MFNKVYLRDKFVNKIYLGETPIKYGKEIPPENVAEVKNLILLVKAAETSSYTDIKSLKITRNDNTIVKADVIWGFGGRKGVGELKQDVVTNGNAGTAVLEGSLSFFNPTKTLSQISIMVFHFNTPQFIQNIELEVKDAKYIDLWVGSKKLQDENSTYVNDYEQNYPIAIIWLDRVQHFNNLNQWTKINFDFIKQTHTISVGTPLSDELQKEYEKMQFEKTNQLIETIPNFK